MAGSEWRVKQGGGQVGGDEDGNDAGGGEVQRLVGRGDADGAQVFNCYMAFRDGRRQGHPPPDDERVGQLQDDEWEARLVQPVGDAGGQVAAAAEEDEVVAEEHAQLASSLANVSNAS